jgi:PadR family transcriptional regulator, regulatory protein PadR
MLRVWRIAADYSARPFWPSIARLFYCVLHCKSPKGSVRRRRDIPRGARCRRRVGPGRWKVRARLERFSEPAVLLLLRDAPAHGYELLEQLPQLMPGERIDMGNLYRILRSLEREELVSSTWDDLSPGPTKRIYAITDSGRTVLDQWVGAFSKAQQQIEAFVRRYEQQRG